MTEFRIKPAEGLTVRDPETYEPLKASGELKPRNGYWLCRLKDGDVELVDDSKTKKKGTDK